MAGSSLCAWLCPGQAVWLSQVSSLGLGFLICEAGGTLKVTPTPVSLSSVPFLGDLQRTGIVQAHWPETGRPCFVRLQARPWGPRAMTPELPREHGDGPSFIRSAPSASRVRACPSRV